METAAAAPGYLTQPIRPLVNDGGRLEVSSLLAAETPTTSPSPSFGDVLSIINPLQHLPVIGPLYRQLTGDELHPAAKVIGGLLFGGPVGLVSAAFNAIFEQATGKSMIETAVALVTGSPTESSVAERKDDATSLFATASATPELPDIGAAPTPPPAAPALQPNVTPPVTAARPSSSGGRDLASYQANAGTRLPSLGGASAPTGTLAPNVPRLVTPVLGTEPIAAPRPQTPTAQSFEANFLRNMQRYESQRRAGEARAALLDRFE